MTRIMPADTPDYMAPAWASCMTWALGEPEIRTAFEEETGLKYVAPQNGLEIAIDEATGHGDEYVRRFVEWASINVWGPVDSATEREREGGGAP